MGDLPQKKKETGNIQMCERTDQLEMGYNDGIEDYRLKIKEKVGL